MNVQQQYIVRVKNGAGWREFSRLRLMISVGKLYHEGAKLAAAVDWINRNPSIEEVQVSVNDLLQRHNLIAFGSDESLAGPIAQAAGTAWIERNEEILSDLHCRWSFTRWDEWFGSDAYHAAHKAIMQLAEEDDGFSEALDLDSTSLAKRKELRGEFVPENLVACSHRYVTEELAVFALQSEHLPAAEVYPGTSLNAVRYLVGKELPAEIASLSTRYVTRIDFERRKEAVVPVSPTQQAVSLKGASAPVPTEERLRA